MADIHPFRPYRYDPTAGKLDELVTQPYDKISPAMQRRYLALSPYNLVRIILGPRLESDTTEDNVYTRAAGYFDQWTKQGVLVQDGQPCFHAYFQEFTLPDSGDRLVRKGFIGLGPVVDYAEGVVHRHEQTLAGPKKDRLELLEHVRAHFGQLFMLYPDPEGAVDGLLDQAAASPPDAQVEDEYGTLHKLWRIADPERIRRIREHMAPKKLLIADGHHRYETALAFRNRHPGLEDARRVMMTFINMHSPGLRILATHRLLHSLARFQPEQFLHTAAGRFRVEALGSLEALKAAFAQPHRGLLRIGVVMEGGARVALLEAARGEDTLDVRVLHEVVLGELVGISPEDVREERYLRYQRGLDAAAAEVAAGRAQAAFLLEATTVEQTGRVAFGGGVMPQKSTDFYPKLLSGLAIYRLER